jgi:hypothetical protein
MRDYGSLEQGASQGASLTAQGALALEMSASIAIASDTIFVLGRDAAVCGAEHPTPEKRERRICRERNTSVTA